MGYAESVWERAMQVHEVVLRALSGEIWFRAADILGMSARTLRRWRGRHRGFNVRHFCEIARVRARLAEERRGRARIAGTVTRWSFAPVAHRRLTGVQASQGGRLRRIDAQAIKAHADVCFRSEYDYALFEYCRIAKVIRFLEASGVPVQGRVLDAGCGGGMPLSLAEESQAVVGIDLVARFKDAEIKLASERGVTNLVFLQADGAALPFRNASFDLALSHAVIERVADAPRYLKECARVLRSGDCVYLSTAPYLSLPGAHLPRLRVPVSLYLLVGRRVAFSAFTIRDRSSTCCGTWHARSTGGCVSAKRDQAAHPGNQHEQHADEQPGTPWILQVEAVRSGARCREGELAIHLEQRHGLAADVRQPRGEEVGADDDRVAATHVDQIDVAAEQVEVPEGARPHRHDHLPGVGLEQLELGPRPRRPTPGAHPTRLEIPFGGFAPHEQVPDAPLAQFGDQCRNGGRVDGSPAERASSHHLVPEAAPDPSVPVLAVEPLAGGVGQIGLEVRLEA